MFLFSSEQNWGGVYYLSSVCQSIDSNILNKDIMMTVSVQVLEPVCRLSLRSGGQSSIMFWLDQCIWNGMEPSGHVSFNVNLKAGSMN